MATKTPNQTDTTEQRGFAVYVDALVIPPVCTGCGRVHGVGGAEVAKSLTWSCWGRNCFDFNFRKDTPGEEKVLCGECESTEYHYFACCGALVDHDCMVGAEVDNDDGDFLGHRCPECGTLEEE